MGWELRHGGRWYLYRNRRVGGRPVKEYLAARDRFGFGELMAHDLDRLQRRQARVRRLTREARAGFRARTDGLFAALAAADADLRAVAEGALYAVGYHKHHRGEWRMRRELASLKGMIEQLEQAQKRRSPAIQYDAPAGDTEAVEVFAKARSGDVAARERVSALIRDRKWVDWIGDLGRQATRQLIHRAAGGDAVWAAGVTEKANALLRELLGGGASVLEELLARRVVNSWVTTHALELELAVRPPADPRDREYLDRALSRAQRRLAGAAAELARVRRLQAPRLVAQLNVAATQTVVNAAGGRPASGECY